MLRSTFLQDAAKSMAMDSPSTSSYLASESVQLELAKRPQNEALPDHQRQSFCTACGNVFIPGWNCSVTGAERSTASNQPEEKSFQRGTIVYHCQACHRRTSFRLSPSPKTTNSTGQGKDARRSPIVGIEIKRQGFANSTSALTKTSSKKRAKARKEKASLQSMLDKSKKDTRISPQLNLMDLMMP
jgi:RNase P subunit RPR2